MDSEEISPDWEKVEMFHDAEEGDDTVRLTPRKTRAMETESQKSAARPVVAEAKDVQVTSVNDESVASGPGGSEILDVDRIIKSCVHSATAMLKDPPTRELRQRKTLRLQQLLRLLDDVGTPVEECKNTYILMLLIYY